MNNVLRGRYQQLVTFMQGYALSQQRLGADVTFQCNVV